MLQDPDEDLSRQIKPVELGIALLKTGHHIKAALIMIKPIEANLFQAQVKGLFPGMAER